jgi:hypothetical protein
VDAGAEDGEPAQAVLRTAVGCVDRMENCIEGEKEVEEGLGLGKASGRKLVLAVPPIQ